MYHVSHNASARMCEEIQIYLKCRGYLKSCNVKRDIEKHYSECYESTIQSAGFGACGKIDPAEHEAGQFLCELCERTKAYALARAYAEVAGKKEKVYYDQLPEDAVVTQEMLQQAVSELAEGSSSKGRKKEV